MLSWSVLSRNGLFFLIIVLCSSQTFCDDNSDDSGSVTYVFSRSGKHDFYWKMPSSEDDVCDMSFSSAKKGLLLDSSGENVIYVNMDNTEDDHTHEQFRQFLSHYHKCRHNTNKEIDIHAFYQAMAEDYQPSGEEQAYCPKSESQANLNSSNTEHNANFWDAFLGFSLNAVSCGKHVYVALAAKGRLDRLNNLIDAFIHTSYASSHIPIEKIQYLLKQIEHISEYLSTTVDVITGGTGAFIYSRQVYGYIKELDRVTTALPIILSPKKEMWHKPFQLLIVSDFLADTRNIWTSIEGLEYEWYSAQMVNKLIITVALAVLSYTVF